MKTRRKEGGEGRVGGKEGGSKYVQLVVETNYYYNYLLCYCLKIDFVDLF